MAVKNLSAKQGFALVVALTVIVNVVIAFDIPFLRLYLAALFYTLVPGWLILVALKLDKLGAVRKLALSVGLSLTFLIFLGFIIDKLYFAVGYLTPLSTVSLISSFSTILLLIAVIAYMTNRDAFAFTLPAFDTGEKAFLVLPALLPLMSILGMNLMNNTDNNSLLMVMLFLIAGYVAFLAVWNRRVPARIYPGIIFLIGISLVLMLALRTSNIVGRDAHYEFYLFQVTADNLHWSIITNDALDACLSVSLLPTLYHSLLGGSELYLFKLLYALLFSISPLIIYVISRKYISNSYAFLASIFFISQVTFLRAAYNARTVTAILFFALAMMVLLSDQIEPAKKRALLIVFIAATIVSHYASASIFFIILLISWLLATLLSRRYVFRRTIGVTTPVLCFVLIFLWYSQLTQGAFSNVVIFGQRTFENLGRFLMTEFMGTQVETALGAGLAGKGIPSVIHVAFTWITFVLIGIGVITMLRRYKRFEGEYLALALIGAALMAASVVLPPLSRLYGIQRTYTQVLVIIAPIFVLGGVWLAQRLKARPSLVLCLVLIPYFLSVTGVTYQIGDSPYKDVALSSEGKEYYEFYVHEEEVYSARWLADHRQLGRLEDRWQEGTGIFTDITGNNRLIGQGKIDRRWTNLDTLIEHVDYSPLPRGFYVYLGYNSVVNNTLRYGKQRREITENSVVLKNLRRIYNNGGSEVWR